MNRETIKQCVVDLDTQDFINAFLVEKCTIMAPTFSDVYEARPIKKYMPERNGAGNYSYFLEKTYTDIEPFDVISKEISVEDMGAFVKYVLLIGVGLKAATIIHYAEQVAGRTPFIRWAYNKENNVIPVSAGGCSEGFEHFNDILNIFAKKVKVANSEWVCYKAADIVNVCVKNIENNPNITHCENRYCDRCNDAVCGGPVLSDGFWVGDSGD